LFRIDGNQVVPLPEDFALSGDEVVISRDRHRLVIEPLRKLGLVALLATMKPLDETFPEIQDPPSSTR